jgi:hypothetical protein
MISDTKGPLVPLILLTLASLVSCSRTRSKPARTQSAPPMPVAVSPSPVTSIPPPKSNRVITIHALDNEYRGSTSILPDNGLDHQKGSHD